MSPTSTLSNNIFQKDELGKVRTAQEDSHINDETPNGHLFVVCDGMGGHVGGAEASSTAVKSIFEFLNKEKYPDIKKALNAALQFANTQILDKVNENPALKGMGTTACILLLQEDKAYIAHVGDSRIYLYLGKEKELHRITKDHSFVQTLVDLPEGHPEKISDDDAENHPNKNRILRALGIKQVLDPTICEKPILPKNGDMFLICSDGLNGMLPDNKIEAVLRKKATLKEKGDRLIALALEAGGYDNITLQLIEISDSPHEKSDFEHCDFTPKPKSKPKSSGKKSKKLPKIFIVLSILFLCIFGAGMAYCFIYKNSKEKRIEQLRTNIKNTYTMYNDLQVAVQKDSASYETIKEKTKDFLYIANNVKDDEKLQKTYNKQKEKDDEAKKKLDDLITNRDSVKKEWKGLISSFPTDSANIVNSKLIKNESNNNRKKSRK